MSAPSIALHSGKKLPIIGLGTWRSSPGQVAEAVKVALLTGYRHLDCAYVYVNETEVGQGLRAAIEASGGSLRREDVFITSKIWNTYHSREGVRKCLQTSLDHLQLVYLDLCLVHWPMGYAEGQDNFPMDENGKEIYSDVHFLETWQALEDLRSEGKALSIGVSNFNSLQLQQVLDNCRYAPEVNQIELHPYLQQHKLVEFCTNRSVAVVAYSPLGSRASPAVNSSDPDVLNDPVLADIASKHGKSVAQVVVRWCVQRGISVIPKSVTPARIAENVDVFDFQLSTDEMDRIASLDSNLRIHPVDWLKDHPLYPFSQPF